MRRNIPTASGAGAEATSEERFRTMADAAPVLMWMADTTAGCDWFNRGWLVFTGRPLEEQLGEGWEKSIHPDDLDRVRDVWRRAFDAREGYELDYRLKRADGVHRWIFDRGVPRFLPDGTFAGFVGSCVDIDDRKVAEARAEASHKRLVFLAAVSNAVTSSLDPAEILRVVTSLAVPRLANMAFGYLAEDGMLHRVAVAHDPVGLFAGLIDARPVPIEADTPVNIAFRTGEVQLTRFDESDIDGTSPEVRRAVEAAGLRSGVAIPLSSSRGERLGVLSLAFSDQTREYTSDDITLGMELAGRVGVAIDNAMLYQWQHSLAEQLQRAVLPDELPSLEALSFDACYRPASIGVEVGGDWYDAFELSDGRFGIVIGDVSGHGIQAASVMSRLRNALRAYALDAHAPADVIHQLCRFHDSTDMFATLVFAIVDPATGEMAWVNAGHPAPLLRRDGEVSVLEGPVGLPVGVDATVPYEEAVSFLEPDDVLLLFTDGLVERRREHLDVGTKVLMEALARPRQFRGMASALVDEALVGRHRQDDVCVLAIHRRR